MPKSSLSTSMTDRDLEWEAWEELQRREWDQWEQRRRAPEPSPSGATAAAWETRTGPLLPPSVRGGPEWGAMGRTAPQPRWERPEGGYRRGDPPPSYSYATLGGGPTTYNRDGMQAGYGGMQGGTQPPHPGPFLVTGGMQQTSTGKPSQNLGGRSRHTDSNEKAAEFDSTYVPSPDPEATRRPRSWGGCGLRPPDDGDGGEDHLPGQVPADEHSKLPGHSRADRQGHLPADKQTNLPGQVSRQDSVASSDDDLTGLPDSYLKNNSRAFLDAQTETHPPPDNIEDRMSMLKKQHVQDMEVFLRNQAEARAEFEKILMEKLKTRRKMSALKKRSQNL